MAEGWRQPSLVVQGLQALGSFCLFGLPPFAATMKARNMVIPKSFLQQCCLTCATVHELGDDLSYTSKYMDLIRMGLKNGNAPRHPWKVNWPIGMEMANQPGKAGKIVVTAVDNGGGGPHLSQIRSLTSEEYNDAVNEFKRRIKEAEEPLLPPHSPTPPPRIEVPEAQFKLILDNPTQGRTMTLPALWAPRMKELKVWHDV